MGVVVDNAADVRLAVVDDVAVAVAVEVEVEVGVIIAALPRPVTRLRRNALVFLASRLMCTPHPSAIL